MSDGYRLDPRQAALTASRPRGLAYGLLDYAEGRRDTEVLPALALRSYHRWMPFHLGQGYGQEGYSELDGRTDWWWYDRAYWEGFFREMVDARINCVVFWNVHPFPALIEYEQFAEANAFDRDRRALNTENFRSILKMGRSWGVDVVLMMYHIHVSCEFATHHQMPFVPRFGYGGEDTPLVRNYNAYCVERLLETYPDLAGLMTCFELNKDAFGFLEHAVLNPMQKFPAVQLHFRLWGQHFADEVRRVCNALPGRVALWHKISEELICLPKADPRIGWWHQQVSEVPIHALVGSGNAAGFNFLGRQFVDPDFFAEQFRDLKRVGGSGIGLFCGDDNSWVNPGEVTDQSQATQTWTRAGWLARHVAGRIAWSLDTSRNQIAQNLAAQVELEPGQAKSLFDGIIEASRSDLPYWRLNSPYGGQREFGLAGACGNYSLQTHAKPPCVFRLAGPYALPLHDWGIQQPDLIQAAKERSLRDEPAKVAAEIEHLCDRASARIPDEPPLSGEARALARYARLNVATARYHAALVHAAACVHRTPYAEDVNHAIAFLEEAVRRGGEALAAASCVRVLTELIPVPRISQRPDLTTPHRIGLVWPEALRHDVTLLEQTLDQLRRFPERFESYRLFWQSHADLYDLVRYLPAQGSHTGDPQRLRARQILTDAMAKAVEACRRNPELPAAWIEVLDDDLARLQPASVGLGEGPQWVQWLSRPFDADLPLPRMLASIARPEAFAAQPRRASRPCTISFQLDDGCVTVELDHVRRAADLTDLRLFTVDSSGTTRRIRVNVDAGTAEGTTAWLVPPHALRFGDPFRPAICIDRGTESLTLRLRMSDLYSGSMTGPHRVNFGFADAGPYWSCVPDAYADGILAYDPQWMGHLLSGGRP